MFGPAQVADADSAGCVTAREFRRADDGMTRARVERIFDTHGRVVRKKVHRLKVRYKGCGGNGAYAKVTYRKRDDGPWRYYSGFGYLN